MLVTPGGGGFGDPKERDRADVAADVRNGKVTDEAAREIYGYGPAQRARTDSEDFIQL